MKVSIIVPNRNYARYLPTCLDSIATQTYKDIEVLLADGGSHDNSLDILKDYAKNYCWRIFSYSDNGQADALAKGFKLASGEILCWLNSDDVFLSNRAIEKMVLYFQDTPSVDVVSLGGYYLDEQGKYIKPVKLLSHPLFSQDKLAYRCGLLQPATSWRKQVFDEVSINTSLRYTFDTDFFLRAFQKYNIVIAQDDYIAGYRLHGSNLSHGVKSERVEEIRLLNRKIFGKGFRASYLSFVVFLITLADHFPLYMSKKMKRLIYLLVNSLSYITIYRWPSI